jgi:hypothetical protein
LAGEGKEFVGLRDAVLIQIAPQAQTGKCAIRTANLAIRIAIQIRESIKTIHG